MKTRRSQALCVAFGISIAATISQANAEVKRIEIESKVVVANGSDANNEIGNYEIITGRAYGILD